MNRYTIYCTKEQTKKAIELGAPIELYDNDKCPHFKWWDNFEYIIPTAEQMCGWLRCRGMKFYFNDITSLWQVVYDINIIGQGCSDNKELAAIDAALDYLSKNKK